MTRGLVWKNVRYSKHFSLSPLSYRPFWVLSEVSASRFGTARSESGGRGRGRGGGRRVEARDAEEGAKESEGVE